MGECLLCEDQLIGNEFHYLFVCKNLTLVQMRSKYIPTYFIDVPTNHTLYGLLSHCNIPLLNRLSLYVRKTSPLFWNMSITSMQLRDQFVMTTWKIYKIRTCRSRDIIRPLYLYIYTPTKVKHHPIFLSIYIFTSILLKQ